jgi:acetyl esterase/lipase
MKVVGIAFLCTLSLAIGSSRAGGQKATDECARTAVAKLEGPGVWQPGTAGQQLPLWPDGRAIQLPETGGLPEYVGNGSPLVAGRLWNWATYIARPTMTIYKPTVAGSGAAMVVLPGGGYAAVAMDLEGTEICDWITALGATCVLLKYRVPQVWPRDARGVSHPPTVQLPLQDAQRAIGLLRSRASEYGLDPRKIGVIGFSAGGHLAAAVSNAEQRSYAAIDAADRVSSIPNFAILLYPGRLWDSKSREAGLHVASWLTISRNAPPTLLIHAMNDPVDDVRHSAAYGLALHDAGVAVDMRFYGNGCHAFGLRPTSDPITTEWPGEAVRWLRHLGMLTTSDRK